VPTLLLSFAKVVRLLLTFKFLIMTDKKSSKLDQLALDLLSRQLDPEHPNYWKARGYTDRPKNYLKKIPPKKG